MTQSKSSRKADFTTREKLNLHSSRRRAPLRRACISMPSRYTLLIGLIVARIQEGAKKSRGIDSWLNLINESAFHTVLQSCESVFLLLPRSNFPPSSFHTSHMAIFKSLYCFLLKSILFQVRPCFLSHNSPPPMISSGSCIRVCALVCLADGAGGLTFSPEAYQLWQMKGTALWAGVALSNCLLTPPGDVNSLKHEAYRYGNWTHRSWQRSTKMHQMARRITRGSHEEETTKSLFYVGQHKVYLGRFPGLPWYI